MWFVSDKSYDKSHELCHHISLITNNTKTRQDQDHESLRNDIKTLTVRSVTSAKKQRSSKTELEIECVSKYHHCIWSWAQEPYLDVKVTT